MGYTGRHLAPRPHSRKTRTFGRALPLALAMVLVMGAVALATHSVTNTTFNPDPPVVGQNLTITVTTNEPTFGNNLILEACRAFNVGDSAEPTGAWSPQEVCGTPDGDWVELKKVAADTVGGLVYSDFPTSQVVAGQTVGFRYKHTPVRAGQHPLSQVSVNKTFVAPAGGDPSPGCKGIENALSKIKKGGQAEASLEKVAEKLNCS